MGDVISFSDNEAVRRRKLIQSILNYIPMDAQEQDEKALIDMQKTWTMKWEE